MRVAVLGCGPTGLVAAHAAAMAGHDVQIFSKVRKSEMFGAQYLHEPIQGVPAGDPEVVTYVLRGTLEQYREKVYGPDYDGSVSPGSLDPGHYAWDIRKTYDRLWEAWSDKVKPADVTPGWLKGIEYDFEIVLSSIPGPRICARPSVHNFAYQGIWAFGDAPARGQKVWLNISEGMVICNGQKTPPWYRASRIFGHTTLEWSQQGPVPRNKHVSEVRKPLWTDCSCFPGIRRLGRYGKWQKGVLVHHAYSEVMECLSSRS